MNSDKNQLKGGKQAPRVHKPISREAIEAGEAEEFISPVATPSRDLHDIPCHRCGSPREDWDGPGVEKGGNFFCSEACAEGW